MSLNEQRLLLHYFNNTHFALHLGLLQQLPEESLLNCLQNYTPLELS